MSCRVARRVASFFLFTQLASLLNDAASVPGVTAGLDLVIRVRGEREAYSRTTAGTVSNNIRGVLAYRKKHSRTVLTCPNHRNSRVDRSRYTLLSRDTFSFQTLQSSDFYRLPFKPHARHSSPTPPLRFIPSGFAPLRASDLRVYQR